MITVKRLRELLAELPDDGQCYGYEGEDVGIGIRLPGDGFAWIRATESDDEDTHTEGFPPKTA